MTLVRAVALASLALGLTASACGGGSPSTTAEKQSAAEWSANVCEAVLDWQHDLLQRSEDIGAASNPKELKLRLRDVSDFILERDEQLIEEVEAAGSPAVPAGELIASNFRAALAGLRTVHLEARAKMQALPEDDPDAFLRLLDEQSEAQKAAVTEVQESAAAALHDRVVPELEKTLSEPPCDSKL